MIVTADSSVDCSTLYSLHIHALDLFMTETLKYLCKKKVGILKTRCHDKIKWKKKIEFEKLAEERLRM